MRVLVLGGTRFLGLAVVEVALAAGARVTTFTRGVSGEPPPQVDALHGDRSSSNDLAILRDGEWDIVVDTSGYVPTVVGESARLLAERAGHYVFVSSVSVFADGGTVPTDDGSPTYDCPPDARREDAAADFAEAYGYLKVGCERAVEQHFGRRCTQVRAGLIVGPHDNAARLPWLVWRIGRRGGEVLAPGDPAQLISMIDARDLAAWFLHCGQAGVSGAYIATAPKGQTTMGELFAILREVSGATATFTWIPDDFLSRHGVQPWEELPMWLPRDRYPHGWDMDPAGALRNGLVWRPIRDTLVDTWEWVRGLAELPRRADRPMTGLAPHREQEILTAWHARSSHT